MNAFVGAGCALIVAGAWSVALAIAAVVLRSPDAAVPIGAAWIIGLVLIGAVVRGQMTPAARAQIDAARVADRSQQHWHGVAVLSWVVLVALCVALLAGWVK